MLRRVFLILCGSLVAYTGAGYSDDSAGTAVLDVVGGTASNASSAPTAAETASAARAIFLIAIVRDYRADPTMVLTTEDLLSLANYATNSKSVDYASLSMQQKAALARIVLKHAVRFPGETLEQFTSDEQKTAGLSDQNRKDLAGAISDIRNGNTLTGAQVLKIKALMPFISKRPTAFILELSPLTQYATLNGKQFTFEDLKVLRQASREASGMSTEQNKILLALAKRGGGSLDPDEARALEALMINAPLGALNGLDPRDIVILHQVAESHPNLFPSDVIRDFNVAYDRNQAVEAQRPGQARQAVTEKAQGRQMDKAESPVKGSRIDRSGNAPQKQFQASPSGSKSLGAGNR